MNVEVSAEDGVSVVTLNRPDVLNAFDDDMGSAALQAVLDAAENRSARCIVITGAGRAFSSGEDLGALAGGYEAGKAPDLGTTLRNRYNPLIRAIRRAPKPVVAAVNGVAAGAGAGVALACDFRIASDKAKLTLAFVKVGLIPDSGALWFLTKMIGASKAWELAATGEPVTAEQAHAMGIFHRIEAAEDFDGSWRRFAADLASGPTEAYAIMKRVADAATHLTLDEQLEREVDAQAAAGVTEDHLEGVRAFLEKRPPVFRGK